MKKLTLAYPLVTWEESLGVCSHTWNRRHRSCARKTINLLKMREGKHRKRSLRYPKQAGKMIAKKVNDNYPPRETLCQSFRRLFNQKASCIPSTLDSPGQFLLPLLDRKWRNLSGTVAKYIFQEKTHFLLVPITCRGLWPGITTVGLEKQKATWWSAKRSPDTIIQLCPLHIVEYARFFKKTIYRCSTYRCANPNHVHISLQKTKGLEFERLIGPCSSYLKSQTNTLPRRNVINISSHFILQTAFIVTYLIGRTERVKDFIRLFGRVYWPRYKK